MYPVSEDVSEVDLNTDVDEYNYDGKLVFRGNLDVQYSTADVSVYWLYDENSKRIGLVEHAGKEHSALWFRDTPFGTLLQEDWGAENKTIWSLMTQAAYEDCMKWDWTTIERVSKRTRLTLVTVSDVISGIKSPETCTRCLGVKQDKCMTTLKKNTFDIFSAIFVDEDGVIYIPPQDTRVYDILKEKAGILELGNLVGTSVPVTIGSGSSSTG